MTKTLLTMGLIIVSSFSMAENVQEMKNVPRNLFDNNMQGMVSQMMGFSGQKQSSPDFDREHRLVTDIQDSIMDGEVEKLTLDNGDQFFSIYTEAETRKVKGAVIIMHNRGYHANWETVVKPLRIDLSQKGWNTLSIQMPVLSKKAKYYDYVPIFPYAQQRIKAAIKFLKYQGIKNIILVGHGCGVHMAMDYIDKYSDKEINGFVGIGMGATDYKQKMKKPFPLLKMNVPILDIYGEDDFSGVKRLAKLRTIDFERFSHKKTKQMIVKDAGHYYKKPAAEKELLAKISTWLDGL
jgi:alpha-beta hydrolase superfamily lysophospholipase